LNDTPAMWLGGWLGGLGRWFRYVGGWVGGWAGGQANIELSWFSNSNGELELGLNWSMAFFSFLILKYVHDKDGNLLFIWVMRAWRW